MSTYYQIKIKKEDFPVKHFLEHQKTPLTPKDIGSIFVNAGSSEGLSYEDHLVWSLILCHISIAMISVLKEKPVEMSSYGNYFLFSLKSWIQGKNTDVTKVCYLLWQITDHYFPIEVIDSLSEKPCWETYGQSEYDDYVTENIDKIQIMPS